MHIIGRAVMVGWLLIGHPTSVAGQDRMILEERAGSIREAPPR